MPSSNRRGLASGAPLNAHFLTDRAESGLSAEVNLGALTTGLLKGTVSAGVSTISTAVAGTDYLADDVISRQALVADAQDITFAVTGDTDEQVEIDIFGPANAGGNEFTIRINNAATAVIYSYYYTLAGATTAQASTGAGFQYDAGSLLRIRMATKTISGAERMGIVDGATKNAANTVKARFSSSFHWPDSSTAITQIVIRGFDADSFKAGTVAIARRRKFT